MSTTITVERFTDAMRQAVAERGEDYVYPHFPRGGEADAYHDEHGTCQYRTWDGVPACIVGVALSKIDLDLVPLWGSNKSAGEILEKFGLPKAVRRAADNAQGEQDGEATWGEALVAYEQTLEKNS